MCILPSMEKNIIKKTETEWDLLVFVTRPRRSVSAGKLSQHNLLIRLKKGNIQRSVYLMDSKDDGEGCYADGYEETLFLFIYYRFLYFCSPSSFPSGGKYSCKNHLSEVVITSNVF